MTGRGRSTLPLPCQILTQSKWNVFRSHPATRKPCGVGLCRSGIHGSSRAFPTARQRLRTALPNPGGHSLLRLHLDHARSTLQASQLKFITGSKFCRSLKKSWNIVRIHVAEMEIAGTSYPIWMFHVPGFSDRHIFVQHTIHSRISGPGLVNQPFQRSRIEVHLDS